MQCRELKPIPTNIGSSMHILYPIQQSGSVNWRTTFTSTKYLFDILYKDSQMQQAWGMSAYYYKHLVWVNYFKISNPVIYILCYFFKVSLIFSLFCANYHFFSAEHVPYVKWLFLWQDCILSALIMMLYAVILKPVHIYNQFFGALLNATCFL